MYKYKLKKIKIPEESVLNSKNSKTYLDSLSFKKREFKTKETYNNTRLIKSSFECCCCCKKVELVGFNDRFNRVFIYKNIIYRKKNSNFFLNKEGFKLNEAE